MPITSSNSAAVGASCLSLSVCAPDGTTRTHHLPAGQVLVIGSSPVCGLRLEGRGIAGMHCTLEFGERQITVRDWSTESGTFLNGERVEEAPVRDSQFELRIDGYLLKCRRGTVASEAPPAATRPRDESPARPLDAKPAAVNASHPTEEQCRFTTSASVADDELLEETDERVSDSEAAAADEWNPDFDPWDCPEGDAAWSPSDGDTWTSHRPVSEEMHSETAELLQAEVEFLKMELAERDERLRTLEELAASETGLAEAEQTVEPEEVERLVERLEQLLAELEQSDARMAALNEMLRTAEDAVQAADQEREHLEGWVSEVDRRVGQWEQEWSAERESLTRQIGELTEQRDQAEQQLAAGGADVATGAAQARLLQQLREEYSRLRAQYLKLREERDALQTRVQSASVGNVEQQIHKAVDTALREERLQLAQEKAALAREKATLVKRQEEIQQQLARKSQETDSADHRIRAFREHLREIYETEPRRPTPTLSQRMGKLWRKLEGRPLDSD
ncbi:MAG: FHA domain-containing protein [Planctomycetaceae bacterium]|nr:FHA domain-containing protein [Planctomycetaceae bacterium]